MPLIEDTGIKVILLDIEGTTTPVDFVYRTLFGFARENLSAFLHRSFNEPRVRTCVNGLKAQHTIDQQTSPGPPEWPSGQVSEVESAVRYGLWLMERDSKIGPLKTLQGLMWEEGYRSGMLRGEVFIDVPKAFDRWYRQGKEISIYSSGSALAQEMLFRTTRFGDLTACVKSFFDTSVGKKTSSESYRKIAADSGYTENQFRFFSDTIGELDAARAAGMQTTLVQRSLEAEVSSSGHPSIKSFDDVG